MFKPKRRIPVLIAATVIIICLTVGSGIMYSQSKYTADLRITAEKNSSQTAVHRTAAFDIRIDGKPTETVDFKTYATTKLSDIQKNGNEYIPNSFLPDAYQTHTVTVTNNSETPAKCSLEVLRDRNDERVFFAVVPESENILQSLCTEGTVTTPEQVKAFTESLSFSDFTFDIGESKTVTMIVWAEHNAVFPDKNGDGIADEPTQKLSGLADGIPSELFTLHYTFEQVD